MWYETSDAAALAAARSQPRLNDAEVTSSPLWNFVPVLRWKVHTEQSSLVSQLVASAGVTLPSGCAWVRPVNSWCVTRVPSDSWELYGSIAVGSVIPRWKVPPG